MDDLEQNSLFRYMGTHSPWWRPTADRNALHLAASESADIIQMVARPAEQAGLLRQLTARTPSLAINPPRYGGHAPGHLVGRQINKNEWARTVPAGHRTPSVARGLAQGRCCAGQVVSGANSV